MKTFNLIKLFFVLILVPMSLIGQTKFESRKYNYSFIYPEGWSRKDQIYDPSVDAKIVDGRGNSFIVSIKSFPTYSSQSAKEQMESLSNQELKEQFDAVSGETEIVKRGTVYVGEKEFYYIHILTPYFDGYKLYHKMFFYSEGYKELAIDACSIESYKDETSPAFGIMISTFEFSNL